MVYKTSLNARILSLNVYGNTLLAIHIKHLRSFFIDNFIIIFNELIYQMGHFIITYLRLKDARIGFNTLDAIDTIQV